MVAIVDDVITSGGSALQAITAVEAMDCRVACVIAVLDRLEGGAEAFARGGFDYVPLLTIRDLGVEPLPHVVHPDVEPMPPLQGP